MLALLVCAALSQTPHTKVAIIPLTNVGLDEKKVSLYSDLLAQELAKGGDFEVTSEAQMEAVLGVERQRQLLGCAATSCATELAGALGADVLLTGSLARVDEGIVMSFRLVGATTSKQLAGFTLQVKNEKELLAALPGAAEVLLRDGRLALKLGPVTPAQGGARALAWIPAVGGAALLATGALCYGLARGAEGRLLSNDPTIPDEGGQAVAATGRAEQTAAFVLGGLGIAALAAAGGMALFGGSTVSAAVAPVPGGGALTISGAF